MRDPELVKLTPQLLEKIQGILANDLDLPPDLREALSAARISALPRLTNGSGGGDETSKDVEVPAKKSDPARDALDVEVEQDQDVPTIDIDVLERLSRWASSNAGSKQLKRKRLDPPDYSLISLLAGTELYIAPTKLSRLKAAEDAQPDKPNPYLPGYLSPSPPSLGTEYRALTRQLSTILNILFSIFGSAAAVYVAATTGGGFTREVGIILAVLAGVVVGIADGVLVWIFSARTKVAREESRKMGMKMGRGSAGEGPKVEVVEVEVEVEVDGVIAEAGEEKMVVEDLGTTALSEGVEPAKRELRLRRRGIGQPEQR